MALCCAAADFFVVVFWFRWHPRGGAGAQAMPLSGAGLTFFAAAKKVSKESGLTPLALRCPSRSITGNGPRRDPPSHHTP